MSHFLFHILKDGSLAPFTLPFQCGNHALIFCITIYVKVPDVEKGHFFSAALMHLLRQYQSRSSGQTASVWMDKPEARLMGVSVWWMRAVGQLNGSFTLAKCATPEPTNQRYRTKQQQCGNWSCLWQLIWEKKHLQLCVGMPLSSCLSHRLS